MFLAKHQLLNHRLPTELFTSEKFPPIEDPMHHRRHPIAWFQLIKDENLQEMKLRLFVTPLGIPEVDLDRFELWVKTMVSENKGD